MQKLPERIDSKYRFVLLASERAEQLIRGALPKISGAPKKATQMAMAEVLADVVEWDFGPAPEIEEPVEEVATDEAGTTEVSS